MNRVIYGLRCPTSKIIRYVGYTKNDPVARLKQHIQEARKNLCHRHRWILSLLRRGVRPEILILESVTQENWETREKYWINSLVANKLVNTTEGGEGLINPSTGVRLKISRKVTRILKGNSRRKGVPHTESTKTHLSKVMKELWKTSLTMRNRKKPRLTKAIREKFAWAKGTKFSKEHRKKISKALEGNKSWLGKKHTEAWKKDLTKRQTGARWVHRGSKNKFLYAGQPIPKGWVLGMNSSTRLRMKAKWKERRTSRSKK